MRFLLALLLVSIICPLAHGDDAKKDDAKKKESEWESLFDGKSLAGWKANENKDSFKVKDGAIVVNGNRSHLFYVFDKPLVNFELVAEVMTRPGSNSGLYFHTKYQDSGWPKHGYEVQINNTHGDRIKTSSLYQVVNVTEAPAQDNEWFKLYLKVDGKHIVVKVDDKTLVDYTEPKDKKPGKNFTRITSEGTIAIQAHDPKSIVLIKSVKLRRLP